MKVVVVVVFTEVTATRFLPLQVHSFRFCDLVIRRLPVFSPVNVGFFCMCDCIESASVDVSMHVGVVGE